MIRGLLVAFILSCLSTAQVLVLNVGIVIDPYYLAKTNFNLKTFLDKIRSNTNSTLYNYFDQNINPIIPKINFNLYEFNDGIGCKFIEDGNIVALTLLDCSKSAIFDGMIASVDIINIVIPEKICDIKIVRKNTLNLHKRADEMSEIINSYFKNQEVHEVVLFKDFNSDLISLISTNWEIDDINKLPTLTFDLENLEKAESQEHLRDIINNEDNFVVSGNLQKYGTFLKKVYDFGGFDQTKFWLFVNAGTLSAIEMRNIFSTIVANESAPYRSKQPNIGVVTLSSAMKQKDCDTLEDRPDFLMKIFLTKAFNCEIEKYPSRFMELATSLIITAISLMEATTKDIIIPPSTPIKCDTLKPYSFSDGIFKIVSDKMVEFKLDKRRYFHALKTDFKSKSLYWENTAFVDMEIGGTYFHLTESGKTLAENPLLQGLFPNQFHTFHNQTLVISTVMNPPFVYGRFNPDNTVSNVTGFTYDIVIELAHMLNFQVQVINPADNQTGALVNGRWTGIVGDIVNNIAHFGIGPISVTPLRSTAVEYMSPFINDGIAILIPKPIESNKMFRMLSPFHWSVWITTIGLLILTGFVMWAISYLSPMSAWNMKIEGATSDEIKLRENVWSVTASILQQGTEFYPNAHSTRTILCTWWITCVIMIASYQADMTSFLTRKIYEPTISSLADLATTDLLSPIIKKGTSTLNYFQVAAPGTVAFDVNKKLGNMPDILDNYDALKLLLKTRQYASLGDRSQLKFINVKNCNTTRLLPDNFNILPMAFPARKNTEYIKALNFYILKMKESGLMTRLFNKWWKGDMICSDTTANAETLDIDSCGGPFILYAVFICLAFLVLATEIVHDRWKKKENAKFQIDRIRSEIDNSIDPSPHNTEVGSTITKH